ncbi:MAG TPA: hypothetical protein VF762_17350, partial [Blastocatellia bacterium]
TFLRRRAAALPVPTSRLVDHVALERIADRDKDMQPLLLVDLQTHVWWRAGGIQKMTPRGESFLRARAGARAGVVGWPVPVADMGRVMFFYDIFLQSKTDIAFL